MGPASRFLTPAPPASTNRMSSGEHRHNGPYFGPGLIDTQRVRRHQRAGRRKRSRPRSTAHFAELAAAAFAGERVGVAQTLEGFVVAVDVAQRHGFHIAARHRQEAAWADVAEVIDEHEPVAVVDAARCTQLAAPFNRVCRQAVTHTPRIALTHDALIVRRFGGFDAEWR